MSSRALQRWDGERASLLNGLSTMHLYVTSAAAKDYPELADQMNRALFTRLASELQGFARELHDEAVEHLVSPQFVPDDALRQLYRSNLIRDRRLSRGNAGEEALATDFRNLGLAIWPAIAAARTEHRMQQLRTWIVWLNTARNAIAHDDVDQLAKARASHPVTLRTYRDCRQQVHVFATTLDTVLGEHLHELTGARPW